MSADVTNAKISFYLLCVIMEPYAVYSTIDYGLLDWTLSLVAGYEHFEERFLHLQGGVILVITYKTVLCHNQETPVHIFIATKTSFIQVVCEVFFSSAISSSYIYGNNE